MMDALLSTVARLTISNIIGADLPTLKNQGPTPSVLAGDEITAEALLAYAKIEQELSVARRTLISETVEIEEYYGNSLKGGLGVKVGTADLGLDASTERGKVTKRVIKFTGFNAQTESMLNAIEASLLSKLKTELSTKQADKSNPSKTIETD